jgi:xylulokinase
VPHVFGSSFPLSGGQARGAYVGLSRSTTQASLLRATLEGMCFQSRRMLDHVGRPQAGDPVRAVGGGSHSPAWMQLKADVLGVPVAVPRIREATALGAAMLAALGAGVYGGVEQAVSIVAERGADRYEPDPLRHALYDEAYREVYLPLTETLIGLDGRSAELQEQARTKGGETSGRTISRAST